MVILRRSFRLLAYIFAPLFSAQDARGALAMFPQIVVLASLLGVAFGFLWSFIPPAIVALSSLLFLSLLAAYRILAKNDELNEQRAQLEIFFDKVFPMWWPEEGWCRVCVRNNSRTTQARDIAVHLCSIEPAPITEFYNVLPSKLGRKDGGTDDCHINPLSEDYFDLVKERNGIIYLQTIAYTGQSFSLDNNVEHRFLIRASTASGEPDEATIILKQRTLPTAGELEIRLERP